jgi:hypothetical protein
MTPKTLCMCFLKCTTTLYMCTKSVHIQPNLDVWAYFLVFLFA